MHSIFSSSEVTRKPANGNCKGNFTADLNKFLKHFKKITYMLFTGREVRIGKNCARGLEYGPRPQAEGRTQDQGHSFSLYGPT